VEARIKGVMLRLGANPGTQNIDRILRLPGTTNLPNEKKRREGRAPCSTLLIEFNNTSHPLSAFPLDEDLSGLPNGLRAQMLLHPEIMRRWRGDKTRLKDQSRSAMDMSLGALLKARGFSFDDMRNILSCFKHGPGAQLKYRDFKRIWQRANTASEAGSELVEKHIERLHKDHAVVLMDGGQVVIMREQAGQPPQFMSPEHFHLWHANDKVDLETRGWRYRACGSHARRGDITRASCSTPVTPPRRITTSGAASPYSRTPARAAKSF
jgi:hypothetical protein